MAHYMSEYERTKEVSKRLLNPSWVNRYCGGDETKATTRLVGHSRWMWP
jgi:hypothetical protein